MNQGQQEDFGSMFIECARLRAGNAELSKKNLEQKAVIEQAQRAPAEKAQLQRILNGRGSNIDEYRAAIDVMCEAGGRASISLVQRKLGIRYMDASTLVQQAVREGFVKKPAHWPDDWDNAKEH